MKMKCFHYPQSFNLIIYNKFHNILKLFDVHQIYFSPQVKRRGIVTYKHGIYELSHELPTQDLRKLGNIRKVPKSHRMLAQRPAPPPPAKIKTPPKPATDRRCPPELENPHWGLRKPRPSNPIGVCHAHPRPITPTPKIMPETRIQRAPNSKKPATFKHFFKKHTCFECM